MSNWAIDGIDFLDYGVYVSRSQGVIDIPPLANISHDWLDENGKEYWENEVRYGDREIVLNCWIRAVAVPPVSAYENFINKVNAFYSAIYSAGSKILTTPFGYVFDVHVTHGIDVTRECNYIATEQIGTFTLRLTVVGDTAYKALAVFRSGSTPVGFLFYDANGLKVQKRLLGENYVTCTFEQDNNVVFQRNDYIFVDVTGNKYEKYFIGSDPQVRKLSSNKFVVNYQFIHESFRLKDCAFLFDNDAEFFWYANVDEIIDKIIENADRTFPGLFVKGTVDSTLRRNHTFSGENCWQVLQRIAAEYELEFDFVYNYPVWTINVQSKISRNWPYTLEYGRGNGLYEITRESVNTDNLCTRLYAYGSTKNIPASYGYKRLKCPTMPVVLNESVYGKKEQVHIFDEIYPNRTGTVGSYLQLISPDGETRGTIGTEYEETDFEVYRIEDTTLFDINEYLLGGLTAKVCMKTGQCAGLEFEILRYDHDNKYIFLIPFKDERGAIFPSAAFPIEAGDEYTLVDIELPSEYLDQAHADLQAAATDLIADLAVPDVVWRAVVDPAFMQNNFDGIEEYRGFNIGDSIGIIDSDLVLNSLCRVSELTKIYYTGQYELVLSERKMLTAREKMNIRLDRIERYQKINGDNTTEVARKDVETTNELRNRIFDPADDLITLDRRVRNESIDPRMLAYDAGVPQFVVYGCLVETNVDDNPEKIKIGAGGIVVLNWAKNALDRYEIKKKIDNGEEYNPSREWTVQEAIIELPTSEMYFLYAKLPRDEMATTAIIFADTQNIRVKDEQDYLIYMLGVINIAQSPRVPAMLWGNVKLVNGREVEFDIVGEYIVWRYVGEDEWNNLIALSELEGAPGDQGANGITPHIGLNGNWYIGETDTGIPATGADGQDGEAGEDGISTYTYVAYASDGEGSDFSLTPSAELKYRAEIHVNSPLSPPTGSDFAGATWVKYLGDDGTPGETGASAFIYIAYASDDEGTDFTMTFNPALDYIAILPTTSEIEVPEASDFAGLWKKYKGEDGGGIGGKEPPELHIDFLDVSEFVYNVPYNMKFTSVDYEDGEPDIDPPLDTELSRYDKVTITPTSVGLVSLYGEYIEE
jgi:hypothetical protein